MPAFFIPNVAPADAEARLAVFADLAQLPVPAPDQRIYSVTFNHNGETWTATVGQKLSGEKITARKNKDRTVSTRSQALSDDATVLAIFPSRPCVVVTDKGLPNGATRSQWQNPFMAGIPTSYELFTQV